jgi:hypothetical protein
MGGYWLHNLPDVLARLPNVSFYDGWENRSRSSGGYDNVLGVVIHHTASNAQPDSDMNYMWNGSGGDQPIGAIYLARDGAITVGCAGATNTQGKGGPLSCKYGTVPLDKGNQNMIAIEAANGGTGEAWPQVQQDRYVELVRALCDGYGFDPTTDVHSHFSYCAPSCPGRKIDPAGPSRFGSVNHNDTWDIELFRVAVLGAPLPPTPVPPTPQPKDDDMPICFIAAAPDRATVFVAFDGAGTAVMGIAADQDMSAMQAAMGNPQVIHISVAQMDEIMARAGRGDES